MIDVNGSHGNQMILGRNFAITANEESGGYTESSIVEDQQMVDVLIKEYDNLFYLIKKPLDLGKTWRFKREGSRLGRN